MSAPEPPPIVRHRSTGYARRYPLGVVLLVALAAVPMLTAVVAGSATLETATRPRTPFVNDAPRGPVVIPGAGDSPSGAHAHLDSVPRPVAHDEPARPARAWTAAGPARRSGTSRGGGTRVPAPVESTPDVAPSPDPPRLPESGFRGRGAGRRWPHHDRDGRPGCSSRRDTDQPDADPPADASPPVETADDAPPRRESPGKSLTQTVSPAGVAGSL